MTGLMWGGGGFGSQPWLQAGSCSKEPAATKKRPAAPLPTLLPTLEQDPSQGGGEWALGSRVSLPVTEGRGTQAHGAEQQVRSKAESHESSSSPSPLTIPHPPRFFFRPCSDCYFVLTAGNGIASTGSQAQLLRKLRRASCESASPLVKGFLFGHAAPGKG